MIDLFSLALIHGLLLVVMVRLLGRDDLDREEPGLGPPACGKRPGRTFRQTRHAKPQGDRAP